MATAAQITACVANAQHSTGPRSLEGKAASSRNSLKFGLYAQAEVLPGENAAEFDQLRHDFEQEFRPVGPVETSLVHDVVRAVWLERRYTRIEAEVINVRYVALSAEDQEFPLGAIYIQDSEGPNVLQKIDRRRAAAQRQFQRALKEIRRLQQERRALDPDAPLPDAPSLIANPVSYMDPHPVRFDKIPNGPATPVRTPHDNWDNPALRL